MFDTGPGFQLVAQPVEGGRGIAFRSENEGVGVGIFRQGGEQVAHAGVGLHALEGIRP